MKLMLLRMYQNYRGHFPWIFALKVLRGLGTHFKPVYDQLITATMDKTTQRVDTVQKMATQFLTSNPIPRNKLQQYWPNAGQAFNVDTNKHYHRSSAKKNQHNKSERKHNKNRSSEPPCDRCAQPDHAEEKCL